MFNTSFKENLSALIKKLETALETTIIGLEKRNTDHSVTMFQPKNQNNGLICDQTKKTKERVEQTVGQFDSGINSSFT